MNASMTMGLIIENRGFFPDHLARKGRAEMIEVLEEAGVKVVAVGNVARNTIESKKCLTSERTS